MFKKVVLFALLLIPMGVIAQETQKIAHFNSAEVITVMPEYKLLQDSMQRETSAVQAELKIMEEEYSKKYQALMAEGETLGESIKKIRLQEIQEIEQRANNFQQLSEERLKQLNQDLFVPIQQKIRAVLEEVGKENNFAYILDAGVILYVNPTSGIDATPLVKKKLGLK
jgi:outer membrane protein